MKTSVILHSQDRVLYGITIRQESKTGFLNLSDLQEAYTQARVKNGWAEKGKIQDIISQKENAERIYYLLKEQGFINTDFSEFMTEVSDKGIVKILKKLGVYSTKGARENKSAWCNPYIWILTAMELNPKLYAKVVTWLTDKLILNRIEAGSFYVELSNAVMKYPNPDYITIAKGLNYIVWNKHEAGIRNLGTQAELKELRDLEAKLAFAINMGYIKSASDLLSEMRKMYQLKWGKKPEYN